MAAVSLVASSMACSVSGRACRFCFVLRVPLRDAGVEIPAVVVEAGLAGQSFDFGAGLFLDVRETDDHVRDLHAGVVDVVLDIDFPARVTQQADKRVAEDGVAQVADVRGLVGIDAGVLDQNLSRGNCGGRLLVGGERSGHPGAINLDIQVARGRDLHFGDAFDGTDLGADGFGNLQRSRAQRLGEGKERDGEIAELHLGRLFDDHFGQSCARITAAKKLCDAPG